MHEDVNPSGIVRNPCERHRGNPMFPRSFAGDLGLKPKATSPLRMTIAKESR